MTPLHLPADLYRQIQVEGVAAFPNECCGMLIGRDLTDEKGARRIVTRLIQGTNVFAADEQYHRFSIDPLQQLKAEKEAAAQGLALLGFYHSHPDHPARPSEYDREHGWPYYSYVIVSIMGAKPEIMTSWVLNDQTNLFEQQDIVVAGGP